MDNLQFSGPLGVNTFILHWLTDTTYLNKLDDGLIKIYLDTESGEASSPFCSSLGVNLEHWTYGQTNIP